MMKEKLLKSILVMMLFLFTGIIGVNAQPPTPMKTPGKDVEQKNVSINRTAPIGTATLLILGLGGAVLGYNIKKNKKENE